MKAGQKRKFKGTNDRKFFFTNSLLITHSITGFPSPKVPYYDFYPNRSKITARYISWRDIEKKIAVDFFFNKCLHRLVQNDLKMISVTLWKLLDFYYLIAFSWSSFVLNQDRAGLNWYSGKRNWYYELRRAFAIFIN